jgi:mRNA interferase HigB
MRVISNSALVSFAARHAEAGEPLQAWRRIISANDFGSFADLRVVFNSVDKVGAYYVFNLGGNKYRLIAAIHFNTGMVFVRHVLTHKEYDRWRP